MKAVASTAGVGPQTKLKLQEDLAASVAQHSADAGFPPAKVGAEVWKALEAAGATQKAVLMGARQAAEAVADRAARSGKPPKEVALAAREATVTAGLTKESLMVQIVGSAATRAVAAEMARKQAGWHEIAAAVVEAAQDSLLPAEFVPRMAATAAAEQAAKAAARRSKSGHEVGLAAAAATQACGVPTTLAGDVAGRAIASALLQSGSGLATMEDVTTAAHAASAPLAISIFAREATLRAATRAVERQQAPEEVARLSLATLTGSGLKEGQKRRYASMALVDTFGKIALDGGGSTAPMDLVKELLRALRTLGAHEQEAAREAAHAAALCAAKVAIAGNESPEEVGRFATMAAQSSGVEVVEATRLAAEAVSRAASESYELSTERSSQQVEMVKAATLATRVPLSVAADLVAAASGAEVAEQSLISGLSPAWMSRKVQAAVLVSGVGKGKSSQIAAKIAANAAASHAAADGAGPLDVRLAAQDALEGSGIAKQDADHLLAQVAAAAMAQRSARLGASASKVGQQAIEAAGGRSHGRVASEAAAEAMARLAVAASLPAAAGLVQEAARGTGVSEPVVAEVAAHALARAAAEKALQEGVSVEEALGSMRQALAEAAKEHREQRPPDRSLPIWKIVVLIFLCLCLLLGAGLVGGEKVFRSAMSSCRGWVGQNSAVNRLARTVCCSRSGPGQQAAYDALEAPGDESDEEPMRHNIAAYPWFLEEDRFQGPPKLVVVLEKAALERSRELIGSRAIAPRPDHPLQITFDALETLLTGEVNQAGRLVVFLHSAQDVYVEVHPGLCLPMSLQSFAKMVAKVLKRRRYTGSSWEAPAVLRVIDGPLRDHLPNDCPWYALSPQGESIQLKDFVRDMVLDSPSGLSCLPGSSGEPAEVALPRAFVFSVGASTGDAMRDPMFANLAQQRISICPWDLTASACCNMLCHEFERCWELRNPEG